MIERDPYGKDPHSGGSKLDAGKRTFAMTLGYFPEALALVDKVSRYGATKYSHGGWKTVPDGVERYTEANLRHVISSLSGEECDPDTGFLHKAHAAWNALAALELALAQAEVERLEKLHKPVIRELYSEADQEKARAMIAAAWEEGEKRMEQIGPNGNCGLAYKDPHG